MFLRRDRDPVDKGFDDMDWLATLSEEDVTNEAPCRAKDGEPTSVSKPRVRPIQMGEYIRKWVMSKRFLRLNAGDVSKTMEAVRQLGVGIPAVQRRSPYLSSCCMPCAGRADYQSPL